MGKHLVDIDEHALRVARAQLETKTIKATVNGALQRVAGSNAVSVKVALDRLAAMEPTPREDAWR